MGVNDHGHGHGHSMNMSFTTPQHITRTIKNYPIAFVHLHPPTTMPPTRSHAKPTIPSPSTNNTPLTTTERRVLYSYINTWTSHHGLDAFASKHWTGDELAFLAATMNEVNAVERADAESTAEHTVVHTAEQNGAGRTETAPKKAGVDIVDVHPPPRSPLDVKLQIRELYQGRLGPLAKLHRRALDVKSRVEEGVVVGRAERFPGMAILVPRVVDGVVVFEDGAIGRVGMGDYEEGGSGGSSEGLVVKKRKIVRLAVDWTRIHFRGDGGMLVLEDGEIWESPTKKGGV